MKAIIENIQHFSLHDGPGTRTTVFFKGCPLSCLWCSNPTTQSSKKQVLHNRDKCVSCASCVNVCPQNAIEMDGANMPKIDRKKCDFCGICIQKCPTRALVVCGVEYTVDEVFEIIKKDILFYQNSGGGVTFSGGEMLMQHEFILKLIEKCRYINIHTAAETSAFGPYKNLYEIAKALQMMYIDLKHIDNEEHKKITGFENTLIIENITKLLDEVSTPIHLRLPLIPTLNDSKEHLTEYAKFVSTLKGLRELEILPYHRLGSTKYSLLGEEYQLEHIRPLEREELIECVETVRANIKNIPVICTG